jgi:hypothetical protein
MEWYRQAVRSGDAAAANNIGTIYRDEGWLRLAIRCDEDEPTQVLDPGRRFTEGKRKPAWAGAASVPRRNEPRSGDYRVMVTEVSSTRKLVELVVAHVVPSTLEPGHEAPTAR